ncbi:MAG: hypothetical protein U5R14_07330 [Gemmatimonadota bacterium]|nr:hypothetical protein [Gemmatimonadota bacterium]
MRVRRRRKKEWVDARKGMSAGRLGALLLITVLVIWYLGWRF